MTDMTEPTSLKVEIQQLSNVTWLLFMPYADSTHYIDSAVPGE